MADKEQDAVRTTIVGGRPPGSGQGLGAIPRGIEVLVRKAAVDAAFRDLLMSDRAAAAKTIDLRLSAAEAAMLAAVPEAQLAAIIDATTVRPKAVPAFLGHSAAAMLVALGAVTTLTGCPSLGHRAPDSEDAQETRQVEPGQEAEEQAEEETPPPVTRGIQPDRPPISKGIQPDLPGGGAGVRPDESETSADESEPEVDKPIIVAGIQPLDPEDDD
jgi:hypothetical protein